MESTFGLGFLRLGGNAREADGKRTAIVASVPLFVQGQSLLPTAEQQQQQQVVEQETTRLVDDKHVAAQNIAKQGTSEEDPSLQQQRDEQALQGRLRAEAILHKFQQQQETLMQLPPMATMAATSNANNDEQPSSAYVEQRRKAAIRERQRRQEAWSKNFAYVATRQEQTSHDMQQRIAAAQQAEMEAQEHYQRVLAQRQQKHKELQSSQAGIGTHKRKRADVVAKTQMGLVAPTAALYLTGIPHDGSVDSRQLRQIFCAYGRITKVHLYRDKLTGDLKGDGLVVYQVESMAERNELMETVCMQMNGAELEDGVVLHVEPAATTDQEESPVVNNPPAIASKLAENLSKEEKEPEKEEDDDDDELKDFFDSV